MNNTPAPGPVNAGRIVARAVVLLVLATGAGLGLALLMGWAIRVFLIAVGWGG